LDADTKGPLRDIHRRVGTAILFESSGGQTDKVAHLPELRFALGQPDLDTTSIDNAAFAFEDRSYFVRKASSDGFRIGYLPTMKKVVSDRRASLDEETEIKPALRKIVEDEFRRGASIPVEFLKGDAAEIPDRPKLTLVVVDPETEWSGDMVLRAQIAEWTRQRGKSPRLYPGALVWCLRKPGRDLREKVELWLAWVRVAREIGEGTLGGEFDKSDRADLHSKVKDAQEAAKEEVWGGYRFAIVADGQKDDGLKVIDLGAGHSSSNETLCGRVIAALKSEALLNESVGAGYIERNWPPALKESGAWPLASLRQSFLNGSLTRLVDPDTILRGKIIEFVAKGDFGLASGHKTGNGYERIWFQEPVVLDEVAFEAGVFLLRKAKAQAIKTGGELESVPGPDIIPTPGPGPEPGPGLAREPEPIPGPRMRTIQLVGTIPPEVWNRLGTKILPKLRSGSDLKVGIDFSVMVSGDTARSLVSELRQILNELGLLDKVNIDER
ncbi:MAG: AAA family ATPase, partial [Acidobacteria bacterium]|nr:AAA family ATPase [Acidobacteriota bacterium]